MGGVALPEEGTVYARHPVKELVNRSNGVEDLMLSVLQWQNRVETMPEKPKSSFQVVIPTICEVDADDVFV